MNLSEIYDKVRNEKFPKITSKFIPTTKFHFMHSSPLTGNIYYNEINIKSMGFSENALKGIIAHELAHQVDYKRKSFVGRIWLRYKCLQNEIYRRKVEREADKITIKRGFGKELLEATKHTKKVFPNNRWKKFEEAHLSIKEIQTLIKKIKQNEGLKGSKNFRI